VTLFIRPRLALKSLELKSTVAWVRLAGEHAGMGLQFVRDEALHAKLEKLLRKLAK